MTNLRVMVVDDEPLAREGLADLLRSMPDITVAGVFGDGMSALQAMESSMPDVLCVDIRMPGLDGFDVEAALDGERMPAVIFITAYDSFAVKASTTTKRANWSCRPHCEPAYSVRIPRVTQFSLLLSTCHW